MRYYRHIIDNNDYSSRSIYGGNLLFYIKAEFDEYKYNV